ncbi:ABC transporter ATP-binding protein [Methanofollis ethanolicus]|uniref:ABC transporter ATP-binding protein n=1 Tax=Methanofollis ethanolicus TaxID=488124 RepID=UPI000835402A|nr:ATP-binding cassette domain-containing protein [Methanofollis ethanolicus]
MIEFRHVSLALGDFSLKDVSLSIEKGDYYFIIGPSGAGKTVVLEAIAGLHLPDAGEVLIRGEDVSTVPPEKRRIALVYQDYSLFPHMTVRENIAFGPRMQRLTKEEVASRTERLLASFGIERLADRYPGTMSGGEQQRVAIARALAVEPEILLLDEPFSALDPLTRERLMIDIARIHRQRGLTIVQVTHAREEALRLATRAAVVIDGRLAQEGPVREVFEDPRSVDVARFVGMENILDGTVTENAGGLARVRVGDADISAISDSSAGERVAVVVGAADVAIARPGEGTGMARNRFEATVTGIVPLGGALVRLHLDCGFPLTALVTRRSADEEGLAAGMIVTASFKASAARTIPTD